MTGMVLAAVSGAGQSVAMHRLTAPGEVVSITEEAARKWALPEVRPGKGRVLLAWEARIEALRASGHREFMRVEINGVPVGARADRLSVRLVNKPDRFFRNDGHPGFWYRADADGWVVVFAPDFEAANRQTRYLFNGHAYDFEIDVTDLLDPDGPDELAIRNLTTHDYVRKWRSGRAAPLIVRNLCLRVDGEPPVAASAPEAVAEASGPAAVAFRLRGGGGLDVRLDGASYGARTARGMGRSFG